MVKGTALVATVAEAARLTGQSAENLESAELELLELLLSASDAIYDRLDTDGHSPSTLTNAEIYKRVVAFHFLALLASHGHFSGGEGERSQEYYDRYQGLSDLYYKQYAKPRTTRDDDPSRSGIGAPGVANILPAPLFGPTSGGGYYTDLPRRL